MTQAIPLTLEEFLDARRRIEPGVKGHLDECEDVEGLRWTDVEWTKQERDMVASLGCAPEVH